MPREFSNLVMRNIRRLAHPSAEAECLARIVFMQVILVCVAHAAQKTWIARKMSCKSPDADVEHDGAEVSASEIESFGQDTADIPAIPLRTLWELIAGIGEQYNALPAGTVFPADTGTGRRSAQPTIAY